MKNFSFLLGAGFSKPAGYPSATEINNKFKTLTHKDFFIHTSQSAYLVPKGTKQNWLIEKYEYMFVEEFIRFYNNTIIQNNNFNYENFYDYYADLNRREVITEDESLFFSQFCQKYDYTLDHHDLLHTFNRTYNQLIANFITIEWPISVSSLKPYNKQEHSQFLNLLEYLSKDYKIHIHTLNHDLLLEKYFHTETLSNRISDGFDDSYSPYFADITFYENNSNNHKPYTHTIRLRKFKNKYDSLFNLYKLHGSVDNYVFNLNNKRYDIIKTVYAINEGSICKEITTQFGLVKKERGYVDVIPEFLSGTTEKSRHYDRTIYYSQVFHHFFQNLINSQILIVIGYGFKDLTINEYLEKYFLKDPQKKMLIIDITEPHCEFLKNNNVKFIQNSVIDINVEEIKNIVNI